MMYVPIDIADIRELHPSLAAVVAREVAHGNLVNTTWRGWPAAGAVCVQLERPLGAGHRASLPADLTYELVDDPHYWYEQLTHANGQIVVTGW